MASIQSREDNGANLQPETQPTSKSVTDDPVQSLDDQHTSSSESTSGDGNGESAEDSETSISNGTSGSSTSYSFGSSIEEDMLHIFGPECSNAPTPSSLKTFKLTGDNLDENVKPSDVRVDSQTKSLHYFQTYAVRDRIDLSSYDDTPPVLDESSMDTTTLLPTEADYKELKNNFTHHIARILKEYMPFFSSFGSGVERHIRHRFYEEMSQKSEVVSCAYSLYTCTCICTDTFG